MCALQPGMILSYRTLKCNKRFFLGLFVVHDKRKTRERCSIIYHLHVPLYRCSVTHNGPKAKARGGQQGHEEFCCHLQGEASCEDEVRKDCRRKSGGFRIFHRPLVSTTYTLILAFSPPSSGSQLCKKEHGVYPSLTLTDLLPHLPLSPLLLSGSII